MATSKKSTSSNKKNAIVVSKEKKKTVPAPKSEKKPTVTKKPVGITKTKPKKKKKSGKVLNFVLSLLMLLGIAIMGCIMVFCGYIVLTAPDFDTDKLYNKEATIFYDKDGNEFARVGSEQRDIKTYEELPEVLVDAIVATEDARYFRHNGFDVVRFVKASIGQFTGQSGAGGASTLTMQVAKNTFSRNEDGTIESHGIDGIIRKFRDIYMSIFLIERSYTKEEIIEFYVNAPYLGQHSYGVEQASQKYFGKSVSDLTLAEASLIAGIFNAPSAYNPFYSTELATQRRSIVLNLMVRHGYITEQQADDAKAISVESLITEKGTGELNKYQQFIDIAANEVKDRTGYDPYETPMLVYTTMDPKIQQVMNDLNSGKLGYKWKKYKYNDYKDINQIGVAITDVKDGSIRAVNGGRFQDRPRAWSRAVQTKTQPGSTAKPIFAYGPFLENIKESSTGTIFYDNKMTFSNGQVLTNADKRYLGPMTMRDALVKSRNIPAVQAFQAVPKNKIGEFAKKLGIDYCMGRKDCPLYESYAIGGGLQVSPLDMAAAYGAFARGGYYIEPYSFTKVVFRESDEVFEYKYEKKTAMKPETAYMITDMLITATKQGVGGNINVPGTQIASKTGTSTYDKNQLKKYNVPDSASADNWVITYSPDYVISFWYGVDKLYYKTYTNAIHAAIERKKISAILADKIYKRNSKFKKPSGIVSSKFEHETYPPQLPSAHTPANFISTELFRSGSQPNEVSDRFNTLKTPTNGTAQTNGSVITLNWNAIPTPEAIDPERLKKHFTDNYGDFADTYYKKRIEYNDKTIGALGYQVYLNTPSGLQSLGFTEDTTFTYNAPTNGKYDFVIKASYSKFKANISGGLNISVTLNSGTPIPPVNPDIPDPAPTPDPENPVIPEPEVSE